MADLAATESQALDTSSNVRTGKTGSGCEWKVHHGDVRAVLSQLAPDSFDCVVTSPPYYWQRDYNVEGQIGLEPAIEDYVNAIADSMDSVRRVLSKSGLLFLNLGDTYYSAKGQPKGNDRKHGARRFGLRAVDASGLGVPRKTSIGMPWRVALEMISRGWTLRSPIVWRRESSLPEPTAHDRPWRTYEMIFMFSRGPRYFFDRTQLSGEEDIWTISDRPQGNGGKHYAAFPDQLARRCLDVGCPVGGRVLDPFGGSGTVARVALSTNRPVELIDINLSFCDYMVSMLEAMP